MLHHGKYTVVSDLKMFNALTQDIQNKQTQLNLKSLSTIQSSSYEYLDERRRASRPRCARRFCLSIVGPIIVAINHCSLTCLCRSITNYPKSFEEYPVEETPYEEQSAVKDDPVKKRPHAFFYHILLNCFRTPSRSFTLD